MAISRERLEELIKQGATIWVRNDYQTYEINTSYFVNIDIIGDVLYCGAEMVYLDYLYETKEEAEWVLKYHATRTEELNLPMWEDFKNSKIKWIGFWSKTYDNYWLYLRYNKIRLICVLDDGYEITEQTWKATEENYIKACDLCIKLFKGEEE